MKRTRLLVAFGLIGLLGVFIIKVVSIGLAITIVFGIGGWFIYQYNGLQSLSKSIKESHSNIHIVMKKRFDLANKLMEIAANYADHETMTHMGIAKLEALPAGGTPNNIEDGMLNRFMMMSRAYPELQANQTYQILMAQLEDIEREIQHKRETYNRQVRTYNTRRTAIPMIFVSQQVGFQAAPYFDAVSADVIEGLKDFKTADGEQLKLFLSDLGDRVREKSELLTNKVEQVTTNYVGKAAPDELNGSSKL